MRRYYKIVASPNARPGESNYHHSNIISCVCESRFATPCPTFITIIIIRPTTDRESTVTHRHASESAGQSIKYS